MMAVIGLWPEGAIVIGVIVLLFGASRLPELGKSLGKGIKEFKKATKELTADDEEEEKKAEGKA